MRRDENLTWKKGGSENWLLIQLSIQLLIRVWSGGRKAYEIG